MTYNNAKESWDWDFTERPTLVLTGMTGAVAGDQTLATTYDTWEQNNVIDDYSDLSYEQYEVTVGGTYSFTDNCYGTASLTYNKFESDELYVYGDEDGDAYFSYIGVGYRF